MNHPRRPLVASCLLILALGFSAPAVADEPNAPSTATASTTAPEPPSSPLSPSSPSPAPGDAPASEPPPPPPTTGGSGLIETAATPALVDDLLTAARRELLGSGDPKAAVRLLETAVAQAPERADAWRLLGQAHSRTGNVDAARTAYTRALALLPADSADAEQVRAVMAFLTLPPKVAGGFVPGAPGAVRIPPEWRVFYRSTLALRYNPLGLFSDNRIAVRRRLFESNSPLFNNNFASIAVFPSLSPAFSRLAIGAELQPASFVTLWGNAELTSFFGTFNLMQSFPSATSNYADSVISTLGDLAAGDQRAPYPTVGGQLNLGADFQFRVGPVVARNQLRFVRAEMKLRDGDAVYYEQLYDVLVPNAGWFMNNDSDLLYVTDFGLTAGVRFNVANAFYGEEHLRVGEQLADIVNGPQARVGPLVAYTFYDDEGALFDRPTVFLIANWWVAHRFRTGVDVPQAVPMVALAFQVQGDLLPWNRPQTP
jgi:hypothetical protein